MRLSRMSHINPRVTGVILAGGQGSRMNYLEKPLLDLGGKPIISHIIENARDQVGQLLINVNRNAEMYTQFSLPIIGDLDGDNAGPLAGLLSAMTWCRRHSPQTDLIACFPGDVPWFPENLVQQLVSAMLTSGCEVGWLRTDGQYQPLFSLWSLALADALDTALRNNVYSPMQFIFTTNHVLLELDDGPITHFLNINSPDDLDKARRLLQVPLKSQL